MIRSSRFVFFFCTSLDKISFIFLLEI